jgi:hypothetical protein
LQILRQGIGTCRTQQLERGIPEMPAAHRVDLILEAG